MSTKKPKVAKLGDYVKQSEVMISVQESMGESGIADLARALGKPYQTVENYYKGKRSVGWDLIFEVMGRTGASLDWLILGKDQSQTFKFDGKQAVEANNSDVQNFTNSPVNGSFVAQGESKRHTPELEHLIGLLEYYGSPFLCKKIEKMILEMNGIKDD